MMNTDMFGSNNNTETNQIALDHVNSSSMEEHQENLYLHFPHSFLDDDDLFLTHILSHHQHQQFFIGGDCWEEQEQVNDHDQTKQNSDKPTIEVVKKKKKKKCSSNGKIGSSTKKTGKDRHSKICTAKGPRDRRMRLSLQIARKFFDLQDMLGFDKASKTIEWLLSNSNSAIKDLKHSLNNNNSGHSYGSVCSGSTEVVSEFIRDNNGGGGAAKEAAFMATLKHKKSRPLRTVGRESRDRARARARQRTILKKTKQPISNSEDQHSCFNLQHVSSELQVEAPSKDSPTTRIQHKVLPISDDLPDFASFQSFFSGNDNTPSQNPDCSTLACPNSIFMASPIPTFSETTLLKLP